MWNEAITTVKDWWPWAEEKASLPRQHLSFLNRLVFHCARNILMHAMLLFHACSHYVQTGLLEATLVNNVRSQLAHVIKCALRSHAYIPLSSAVHERMFRNQIRRYLISNTQFIPPHPHRSGPFLPRLPDAERDSGAEWGGTRAPVSPVKAKDLVRPSIPLGSPSNTHIATKYCKGTSRSSASYILMLLSGYKLFDFV